MRARIEKRSYATWHSCDCWLLLAMHILIYKYVVYVCQVWVQCIYLEACMYSILHIGKCNIIIQYISSYFIFTAAGDFGSLFVSWWSWSLQFYMNEWMNEWIILYGRLLFLQWHLVSRNRLSIFHINTYLLCRKYFRLWGDPKLIEDQHSLFWHFFYWRRLVANNCFFFILHLCSAVYFLFRLKAQANNDFGGKTSSKWKKFLRRQSFLVRKYVT